MKSYLKKKKKVYIRIADPGHLSEFSAAESLQLATLITSSGISLTEAQLEAIAEHIAENTPLDNITGLANGLPLSCFDATAPSKLISLLSQMDLHKMYDSKKMYLSRLVNYKRSTKLIKQVIIY